MSFTQKLVFTLALFASVGLAGSGCDGTEGSGGPEAAGACSVAGAPGTQQQVGPFATQTTAWERYREHRDQGCEMSEGVFPCYVGDFTRGYCFNVFF